MSLVFSGFIEAAEEGDAERLKSLVANGADPNGQRFITGETALVAAARSGSVDCVHALIAAGADVNKHVYKMGDFGVECNTTALITAAGSGSVDCVRALIAAGADVDKITYETALMRAAAKGHADCVRALIAAGADVNKNPGYGGTALMMAMMAIDKGQADCVHALIAAGADVNKNPGYDYDKTALIVAIDKGNADWVRALIAAGADVNKGSYLGKSALMMAIDKGNADWVRALIAAGADVNKGSYLGKSALMMAIDKGNADWVQALIAAGADVNATSRFRPTPLHDAICSGRKDIANLLRRHGGKRTAREMLSWAVDPVLRMAEWVSTSPSEIRPAWKGLWERLFSRRSSAVHATPQPNSVPLSATPIPPRPAASDGGTNVAENPTAKKGNPFLILVGLNMAILGAFLLFNWDAFTDQNKHINALWWPLILLPAALLLWFGEREMKRLRPERDSPVDTEFDGDQDSPTLANSSSEVATHGPNIELIQRLVRASSGAHDFINQAEKAGFRPVENKGILGPGKVDMSPLLGSMYRKGETTFIFGVYASKGPDTIYNLSAVEAKGSDIVSLISEGERQF